MARHAKSGVDRAKWPVSGQSNRLAISRTTVAFWRKKVFKVKGRDGTESPDFSARIGYLNRRERFPLKTPNKEAAATKAAQIFGHLLDHGWEATIAEFKPEAVQANSAPESEGDSRTTVGTLIAANEKYSTARPQSLEAYAKALRRIVGGLIEVPDDNKYQSRGDCGFKEWRKQIDEVPLADLTPSGIQAWKQSYLKQAGRSADAQRKAITTVNSLIRNAKALFSKKLLPFLEEDLKLPSPLPFEGVTMEKPPSPRYRSKMDAKGILTLSHSELKDKHPEPYKALLLALVCGLRVSEIDHLLWTAFDFEEGILRVQDSEYHRLKSEDSAGDVALSDDMIALFSEYSKGSGGEFVIESDNKPNPGTHSRHYRCDKHFETLRAWLKKKGIAAAKPIHELRKEIGSIIASEEGIFAASRYLRHSDIRITSSIYADQKTRVVPSLGASLS